MDGETEVQTEQAEQPATETETKVEQPDLGSETEKTEKTEQTEGKKPEGEEAKKDDDAGEKSKRESGSQRLKRQRDAALAEVDEWRRRAEELESSRDKDGKSPDPEPQEKDFNGDYLGYERALRRWEIRQELRAERRTTEDRTQASKQAEARREVADAYNERLEEARERIPDFDDVLKATKGTHAEPRVVDAIMDSDKGPLLAYHLAKNPETLQHLNELRGTALARAIGRLEGSVRMPAGKQQTAAGKPPTPLKGGATPAFDPFSASMDDYAAEWEKRNKK